MYILTPPPTSPRYRRPETKGMCSQCFGKVYPEEAAALKKQRAAEKLKSKLEESASKPIAAKPVATSTSSSMPIPSLPSSSSGSQQGQSLKQPTKVATAKVARNDPCPCGSGRKYKKCHG